MDTAVKNLEHSPSSAGSDGIPDHVVSEDTKGSTIEAQGNATPVNTEVSLSLMATIPFTKNSLRKIPPEIRERIFYFSSITTETLSALIGDQVIYQEALKVYWDTVRCTIPCDIDCPWSFSKNCALSQKSLNSMKKVKLMHTELWQQTMSESRSGILCSPFNDFNGWKGWQSQTPPMKELANLAISDLRLTFNTERSPVKTFTRHPHWGTAKQSIYTVVTAQGIVLAARDCMAAFHGTDPGLKIFNCEITPHQKIYLGHKNEDYAITILNAAFGVTAKLSFVDDGTCPTVYTWVDAEGKPLQWDAQLIPNMHHGRLMTIDAALESSPYFQKNRVMKNKSRG